MFRDNLWKIWNKSIKLAIILRRPGSHAKYFVLPDFDTGKKGFVVDEKDTCIFIYLNVRNVCLVDALR